MDGLSYEEMEAMYYSGQKLSDDQLLKQAEELDKSYQESHDWHQARQAGQEIDVEHWEEEDYK